jgi:hypothetical protein
VRSAIVILGFLSLLPAVRSGATALATPQAHSHQILIPAAASAPGARGTHFRSDIRITNLRAVTQKVYLQWVPEGGGPVPAQVFVNVVEIPGGATLASDDFVREVMNTAGVGAILVRALNASDEHDLGGRLHVTSRIYTPQPGTEGISSQSLTPLRLQDVVSERLVIIGHRRNERFRTNVGIVNLDITGAHTFLITVTGETPTLVPEIHRVTVPALGLLQIPLPGVQQEQLRIDIQEDVVPGQGHLTLWTAYASSVDNVSGDGWTTVGFNLE